MVRPMAVLTLLRCLAAGCAEPPEIADEIDRQVLTAFLGHTDRLPERLTAERMAMFAETPEKIT